MSHAAPDIIYNYEYIDAKAAYNSPLNTTLVGVTSDYKAILADLRASTGPNEGATPRSNPDFGVFTYPLSTQQIEEIKNANNLLMNKAKIQPFSEYNNLINLRYSLRKSYNDSYEGGTVDINKLGYVANHPPEANSSSKEIEEYKTAKTIIKALGNLNDIKNKDRKRIATTTITYDLVPQKDNLRVDVHFKIIGDVKGTVSNPSDWVALEVNEDIEALKQWMTVSYTGIYKNQSYSTELQILPKYLDKKTLVQREKDLNEYLTLKPNSTRTISFNIPYKDISFYSSNDDKYLAWNEGNRTKDGQVLFDHAALRGSWYLKLSLDKFSSYVGRTNEALTQLK